MTRYAIGDVQGCYDELRALIERIGFSADRDQLWFVGDLVNRGPKSLEVLRYVRSLGDNGGDGSRQSRSASARPGVRHAIASSKSGDTLDEVLAAKDRDALLEWLMTPPAGAFRCRARRPAGARRADSAMERGRCAQVVRRSAGGDPRRCPQGLRRDVRQQARVLEREAAAARSGCASRSTCSRACASARRRAASTWR